jgi:hypothetical protein
MPAFKVLLLSLMCPIVGLCTRHLDVRVVSQCGVKLSEVCSLVYCLSSWIVSVVFL